MAITRRQFVTRLGALAAAVGMSQADVSKMTETFAGQTAALGGFANKPRVVWIHGAECTGCSTSLLSFLEDPAGEAIYTTGISTGTALGIAGVQSTQKTLGLADTASGFTLDGALRADGGLANVADVVIDVVDLQYHETVMGMGGDLAYQWLKDFKANNTLPFVLVVEGALQDADQGGAWGDTDGNGTAWCSIGMNDAGTEEHDMALTVKTLATKTACLAVIPIGQCACYGGYPGCKPPITSAMAGGFDPKLAQSGAQGVADYLNTHSASGAAGKVINVPGCPTNPWWFCLTVVMFLANVHDPSTMTPLMGTDYAGRLKNVYPIPVHSQWCPRYGDYVRGRYAAKPGDAGCLQKIGCKGIATNSLCGVHGWNNQQPQNATSPVNLDTVKRGGHCTRAGAPCMACTEKGYPDSFVPFVKR